jgi:hypothetical protein
VINGSIVFTGQFSTSPVERVSLTVTAAPSSGGSTAPESGLTVSVVKAIPYSISATPAEGHYFSAWSANVASAVFGDALSSGTTVTLAEDTVVICGFTTTAPTTYVLTMAVTPESGGTTVPEVGSETTLRSGQTVTITAVPANTFVFVGWKGEPSGNVSFGNASQAETTATVTGNVTLTAMFSTGGLKVGTGKISSGYRESVKKIDGEPTVVYRNKAGFSAKMKTDLKVTEETAVEIYAGFYSFYGVLGEAATKKFTEKGGIARFIDKDTGETVVVQWRSGTALVSVKLAPPADSDLNFLDLYDEVYGETNKVPLTGEVPVWISVGDRILSGTIPYAGTGLSKPNKPLEDDLVKWSVKGAGKMEEMTPLPSSRLP